MRINVDYPVVIHEDNQSAIAIAKNVGYQSRAKHIDIKYHFIPEQVKAKNIDLQYIETRLQLADFMTKPISTKKFEQLLIMSNIKNLSSRGSVEADVPDQCRTHLSSLQLLDNKSMAVGV
uniref:Polyprotein putative n=1 Tax=Albugo laibachii Nc14 TaxID=890382 RepID=F0X2D0_9STRA|nr:polyprotein putative [Albugo laibachii Nc14]|eukprot:CCA28016.1 polyprotein putative [Albugo laibachii Nc14]